MPSQPSTQGPKSRLTGRVWQAAPAVFVLLWSSGYIAGTLGVRALPPLTLTFWRFALAALLLAAAAVASGASWPRGRSVWTSLVITGVTLQAVQGIGTYLGLRAGVSAGLSALLLGLSPIAVALAARVTLHERLTGRQLLGSLLGLGGVTVALSGQVRTAGAGAGLAFTVLGLAGFVTGTLYQKRHGAMMDLRTGGCVQFAAAALPVLPLAATQGPLALPLTAAALGPLAWLTLVNSLAAVTLLFLLLRRGTSTNTASLFYLVPPVTAVLAVPTLDQPLTAPVLTGLLLAATGVYLVTLSTNTKAPTGAR